MTKGKSTWKRNKLLTARNNYFLDGGNVDNGAGTFNSGIMGLAGAAAADIATMINNIAASDVKSRKNLLLANASSSQMKPVANDSFNRLIDSYSNTANLNYVTGEDLGAKNAGQVFGDALIAGLRGSAAGFGMANGGTLRRSHKYMGGGPIGAIIGGVMGTGTSLIGNLIRNHKASLAADAVNRLIDYTNDFNQRSLANRADNLITGLMDFLNSNYMAFGGNIGKSNKINTFSNNNYQEGQIYDVDEEEVELLKSLGYEIEVI